MSFNISFQPSAASLGSYAYQASAIKQARDNLDQSIARNQQAAEFNARLGQSAMEWAADRNDKLAQQAYSNNYAERKQAYDQASAYQDRIDKAQQYQSALDARMQIGYDNSRSDFDKTLAQGVKDGWLRIEPEQKQKLRQLAAADSQVSMRDDLDEATKIRMLSAIHNERRNILPTIVPEFDRPTGMDEQVAGNVVVVGRSGIRRLAPGESMRPGEAMYHVGNRNGAQHMSRIEFGDEEKQPTGSGATKDWGRMSPAMKYSSIREEYDNRWDRVAKQMLDNIRHHDALGINNKPVFGYEVTHAPDGSSSIQMREFDLNNPADMRAYSQSAMLLTTPGMAYNDDNILNEINRRDQIVGGMGGASSQGFQSSQDVYDTGMTPDEIDASPDIPAGSVVIGRDPETGLRRRYEKRPD